MDAQLSSLNFEQSPETPEKGIEEINGVPQNTPPVETETPASTGIETSALPPVPENVKDERKEAAPEHPVTAGDYLTSLADGLERIAIDEFQKNNLPNGSA